MVVGWRSISVPGSLKNLHICDFENVDVYISGKIENPKQQQACMLHLLLFDLVALCCLCALYTMCVCCFCWGRLCFLSPPTLT